MLFHLGKTHTHAYKGQLSLYPKVVGLFFNLLDYKISDLGTTELMISNCLLAVIYLALHSTTNNIFALRLLAGTRT